MFLYLYTRITTQFYTYKWPRLLHYTEYKCTQQTINISWINSIQVTNAQIRFVRCAHYNNRSQSKFLSLLCQPRSMLAITFFLLQTKWPTHYFLRANCSHYIFTQTFPLPGITSRSNLFKKQSNTTSSGQLSHTHHTLTPPFLSTFCCLAYMHIYDRCTILLYTT